MSSRARLSLRPSRHTTRTALFALALASLAASCASAEEPASNPAPSDGRPPIVVDHAWQRFLEFHEAVEASGNPDPESRLALAPSYYGGPDDRWVRAYLAARGGGDAELSLEEWSYLPWNALDAVAAALSRPGFAEELEAGASDLVSRLETVSSPGDTVALVFLVGGYQHYFTQFDHGGTQVIAVHLESFVPWPEDLSETEERDLDFAVMWRPDTLATLQDVMPWTAYAYTLLFVPEIRERMIGDTASLAEFVLGHGFSNRFAGALYPESLFGGGRPPVHEAARLALQPRWREIGGSWIDLGGETYLSALFDERMEAELPEGTTVQQAVHVVATNLAEEWLAGTRIGRTANELEEIAALGRVPTLNAWNLLVY